MLRHSPTASVFFYRLTGAVCFFGFFGVATSLFEDDSDLRLLLLLLRRQVSRALVLPNGAGHGRHTHAPPPDTALRAIASRSIATLARGSARARRTLGGDAAVVAALASIAHVDTAAARASRQRGSADADVEDYDDGEDEDEEEAAETGGDSAGSGVRAAAAARTLASAGLLGDAHGRGEGHAACVAATDGALHALHNLVYATSPCCDSSSPSVQQNLTNAIVFAGTSPTTMSASAAVRSRRFSSLRIKPTAVCAPHPLRPHPQRRRPRATAAPPPLQVAAMVRHRRRARGRSSRRRSLVFA